MDYITRNVLFIIGGVSLTFLIIAFLGGMGPEEILRNGNVYTWEEIINRSQTRIDVP